MCFNSNNRRRTKQTTQWQCPARPYNANSAVLLKYFSSVLTECSHLYVHNVLGLKVKTPDLKRNSAESVSIKGKNCVTALWRSESDRTAVSVLSVRHVHTKKKVHWGSFRKSKSLKFQPMRRPEGPSAAPEEQKHSFNGDTENHTCTPTQLWLSFSR